MKSLTTHYSLQYDNQERFHFETFVDVPKVGVCTFFSCMTCSKLMNHYTDFKPKVVGKAFRWNKEYKVEVFLNRMVAYK